MGFLKKNLLNGFLMIQYYLPTYVHHYDAQKKTFLHLLVLSQLLLTMVHISSMLVVG